MRLRHRNSAAVLTRVIESDIHSKLGLLVDKKFHPAIAAIKSGDADRLRELIRADATLATSRSTTSHPTLLQCLVLQGGSTPNLIEMARILIDAGADLDGPLSACGSCDNVAAAQLLLDCGAAINGSGGWSPLEEALYWHSRGVIDLLVRRGASIHNLRIAAGLGRTDAIERFFADDGSLRPEAGTINWPWGDLDVIEYSNFERNGKDTLGAKFRSWTHDRQQCLCLCVHARSYRSRETPPGQRRPDQHDSGRVRLRGYRITLCGP